MLHAVVIGINCYVHPRFPDLRSARADAQVVAGRLLQSIVPPDRNVNLLVDQQATRSGIIKAIGEALPRHQSREDLILIYFAGHGSPEQRAPPDRISRYLVPYDADYDHIFATGVGFETDVVELLERQLAGRVLFIIDSCFSGRAGGRSIFGPHLQRRLSQLRAPLSLRELELGFGKAILSACRDDELAQERNDHGIFTRNLIDALSREGPPTVGVGDVYEQVFDAVVRDTSQRQHPVFRGHIEGMRLPRLLTKSGGE